MSLHPYQIETTLDFGDIGTQPVVADGVVELSGLFGPGRGYRNVRLEKVQVFIKDRVINVTDIISKHAWADLEQQIERAFERDTAREGA